MPALCPPEPPGLRGPRHKGRARSQHRAVRWGFCITLEIACSSASALSGGSGSQNSSFPLQGDLVNRFLLSCEAGWTRHSLASLCPEKAGPSDSLSPSPGAARDSPAVHSSWRFGKWVLHPEHGASWPQHRFTNTRVPSHSRQGRTYPISQLRRWRHRVGKQSEQGHTAGRGKRPPSSPVLCLERGSRTPGGGIELQRLRSRTLRST